MLIESRNNVISNLSGLKSEAESLTYYTAGNHPDISPPFICNISGNISSAGGVLQSSISELINISQEITGSTFTNYYPYCQWYNQSSNTPYIHWDTILKTDPELVVDYVALLSLSANSYSFEFWQDDTEGSYNSTAIDTVSMEQNKLIVFNHQYAHKLENVNWGTNVSDSPLMLAIFMNSL